MFKESLVSKKWNKSGATLDERWRRRRTKDKKEMDDDRWSGVTTKKVEATARIWGFFFFSSLVYTLWADFHFSADIWYFSRGSWYVLVWPDIWRERKAVFLFQPKHWYRKFWPYRLLWYRNRLPWLNLQPPNTYYT